MQKIDGLKLMGKCKWVQSMVLPLYKSAAFFLLLVSTLLVNACAVRVQNLDAIDTTNYNQLISVKYIPRSPSTARVTSSNLRARMLEDSALSIGAQAGLAWASEKINVQMTHDRRYLDTIYNFSGMMLTHGVIPPVLVEGDYTLNLDDPTTIRVSDRTFKIVKQARFATTPPNWREYLWLSYTKPELPNRTLLPRTYEEQCVWRKAIRMGWEKGIEQAYSIFHQNLARLKRDFAGMILYRKLLQQKMISQPFVSRTELGVTGNGDDMHVNDQVLRIVELPQLQTNSKKWEAIVIKGRT